MKYFAIMLAIFFLGLVTMAVLSTSNAPEQDEIADIVQMSPVQDTFTIQFENGGHYNVIVWCDPVKHTEYLVVPNVGITPRYLTQDVIATC